MGTTMIELTSAKLEEFVDYYHGLHDTAIKRVEYNVADATVSLKLEIFWAGESVLSDDGIHYVGTKSKNVTLLFEGVVRFNFTEIDSADFIYDVFFKLIDKNNTPGTCWQDKPIIVFAIGEEFDCDEYIFAGSKPSMWNFIVAEKASYCVE